MSSTAIATPQLPPDVPDNIHEQSDGSKIKAFFSIIKKFIGVADLAAVRFSLPAQLLEPTPNLEYWNYLDAPNAFVAIGTSDDPLERMLEVCRFWFSKDLKYCKGKPCKPYNSCLGEFFRCNWDAEDNAPPITAKAIVGSGGSSGSKRGSSLLSLKSSSGGGATPAAASTVSIPNQSNSGAHKTVRVSYLTEQTSHHPPVSAFYVSCPERGLHARGYDQIKAKFTGTTVKVLPGEHNLGIFITIDRRGGETYRLTHPAAHLGGFLMGGLNITVGEQCYITCAETRLKAILQYSDQGWTKSVNIVEGVIFRYDPAHDNCMRVKDVPSKDVLARLGGPWKEKVVYTLGPKPLSSHPPEECTTIIDIAPLEVAPKQLPPVDKQMPHESLQMWAGVTAAIHAKQFGKATVVKSELEERQREKARAREAAGTTFQPVFFKHVTGNEGKPELTDVGRQVLDRAYRNEWDISDLVEPQV